EAGTNAAGLPAECCRCRAFHTFHPFRQMAYRYTYSRPVDFYETDMAGIAHFSNFFRWMEAAEAAFFTSLDASLVEPLDGGAAIRGWPRVRVHCEYHAPVRFGDTLTIELLVKELKVRAIE